MTKRKYSDQEFIKAVANNTTIAAVLSALSLKVAGGNYQCANKRILELNLSTSHFTRQGWAKNKVLSPKRNLQEYLDNKFPIQSHKLRLRLLKENVFEYKCHKCRLTEWLGQPIPLELEHVDGNNKNNNIENLMLLCPNCHAQTDTYRGKNINKKASLGIAI